MIPVLSVSIISYNTRELLRQCLQTLRERENEGQFQILVVDNGSKDGSVELVRDEFPEVELIESGGNIGFGRANNLAFEKATGKYFLLLNSDAFPEAGALEKMAAFLDENPEVGAVGPQLLNLDGSNQASWGDDPVLSGIFWEQTFLGSVRGRFFKSALVEEVVGAREVDQLPGACEMVRREAYAKISGFDPNFWMYVEDVDLNIRLRQNGWKIVFLPEAKVKHHLGGSSGKWQSRAKMVAAYNASRFYFYGRHVGPNAALYVKFWTVFGALFRLTGWTFLALWKPKAREKIKLFRHVLRETARL